MEKQSGRRQFDDLTDLLLQLRADDATTSVLLETRSGAGKTIAQRKAFFDCFWAQEQSQPKLAGYVPCWGQLGSQLPAIERVKKQLGRDQSTISALAAVSAREIVEWLAFTAGLASAHSRPEEIDRAADLVDEFLHTAPPLLLLAEFNAAERAERLVLAVGLREFQKKYGPLGHRCVVAYRSAVARDGVLSNLGADQPEPTFVRYNLKPLSAAQAGRYL